MKGAGKIIGHEIRKAKMRGTEKALQEKQREKANLRKLNLPGLIEDYYLSGKYGPGELFRGYKDPYVQKTYDMINFIGSEIFNTLQQYLSPFPELSVLIQAITDGAIVGLQVSYVFEDLFAMVTSFPIEKSLSELCLYFRHRLLRPNFVPVPIPYMDEEQRKKNDYINHVFSEAMSSASQGDYNTSIDFLLKLLELYPDNTLIYEHIIVDCHQMQDWDKAIEYSNKLVSIFPSSENYWSDLGKAYAKKGDYTNAAANYKEALKIFINDKYVLYALGEMYRTLDQMDFALWCFERAAGFGHYSAQKGAKKLKRKKAKPVAPF